MNFKERIDTLQYFLSYPHRPVMKTKTIELIHFDEMPAGQNAMVAVMSYSGFDIEDASIMNKASIDRGFARSFVYRSQKCDLKKYANPEIAIVQSDRIRGPMVSAEPPHLPIFRHACLDLDGIASPGEKVENKQTIVNKQSPVMSVDTKLDEKGLAKQMVENEFRDTPLSYKGIEGSVVERVMITSTHEKPCLIKLNMRQQRIPEIGDKMRLELDEL